MSAVEWPPGDPAELAHELRRAASVLGAAGSAKTAGWLALIVERHAYVGPWGICAACPVGTPWPCEAIRSAASVAEVLVAEPLGGR